MKTIEQTSMEIASASGRVVARLKRFKNKPDLGVWVATSIENGITFERLCDRDVMGGIAASALTQARSQILRPRRKQ